MNVKTDRKLRTIEKYIWIWNFQYSLGPIHPLLGELSLAVHRIFVRAVGDHLDALPVPGLFGAVLGNHVELTDVVLKCLTYSSLSVS